MKPDLIARAAASKALAGVLADRTAFVVTVPPGRVLALMDRLSPLAGRITLYADTGLPLVLATDRPKDVAVEALLQKVTAVAVIPKRLPHGDVARAVERRDLTASGLHDVIVLTSGADEVALPTLFVDALGQVEPAFADAIRAEAA